MVVTITPPLSVSRAWVEQAVETLISWLDDLDAPFAELEDVGDLEPEAGH